MERIEALQSYYNTHDEEERFSPNHGKVEFLTTMHYIEKYLRPGMRVLEIGAGTGRYSHALAQRGYEVDAVELMERNIEIFRTKTQPGERVTVQKGDAINLSRVPSDEYDLTLLLGPMYHLFTQADQLAALREAIRVTRPGGVGFVAYCNNDMTVYQYCFRRGAFQKGLVKDELVDYETFSLASRPEEVFALHRREDVDRLMAHFPVTRLHYVGTDLVSHFMREALDEMDENTFALYMKYHLCVCARSDMVGMTNHMLDIFRVNA